MLELNKGIYNRLCVAKFLFTVMLQYISELGTSCQSSKGFEITHLITQYQNAPSVTKAMKIPVSVQ